MDSNTSSGRPEGQNRSRGGGRGRGRDQSRGRGRGRGGDRGGRQRGEQGRGEWGRNPVDKRKRNDEEQAAKRRKLEDGGAPSNVGVEYSKDEIAAEDRKPKRKVAVLLGYAGSGYKGMQINATGKTIEGDLFTAFIKAGAISKANADDPKKSSLVRCARTDKGVHAAGNVISLKLIVEDPDIVKKINENLPEQIRVWGFERTNGSFSCYQTCDSRWYEYLIPTYSFLPPHPQSYMGKMLVESAEKEGVIESYKARQEDVAHFWEEAEKNYVEPILAKLDPELRAQVLEAFHATEDPPKAEKKPAAEESSTGGNVEAEVDPMDVKPSANADGSVPPKSEDSAVVLEPQTDATATITTEAASGPSPLDAAIKEIKNAYIQAKKAYRISSTRRAAVQDALSTYLGTQNFHNYTILKTFKDPSAKRVIRSFNVGSEPIIINNTEWLSLKVHGQSFMMHQIRKMVAMVALVVRCGTPLERIKESYGPDNISIPKAPGLGLLLERPVFETYNKRAVTEYEKEPLDFEKYAKEIEAFKQKEIYERIFREEEKDHQFHTFFHHIDNYRTDYFLWVTATGIQAAKTSLKKGELKMKEMEESEDEADINGEEG